MISFADNYVVTAQKGAMLTWQDLYKKEEERTHGSRPAYIKGNFIATRSMYSVAANVASSQNLLTDLLEKYGIDISNVNSYETLSLFWKQSKKSQTLPFAIVKNFIPSNFDYPVANGLPLLSIWGKHYSSTLWSPSRRTLEDSSQILQCWIHS